MHGLRDVPGLDAFPASQIGDGAGNPQYPGVGAGREAEAIDSPGKKGTGSFVETAVPLELVSRERRVVKARAVVASLLLSSAGRQDPCANGGARFSLGLAQKFVTGDGRHLDVQIDPVEEGPGKAASISFGHLCGTATGLDGVARVTARTGIHSGDQYQIGGKLQTLSDPGDENAPLFEGLPKRLQMATGELGQFVEEENAPMRESDLPGPDGASSAEQCRPRGGVMRGSKGAVCDERTLAEQPCDAVDGGTLEGFVQSQIGQDAWHSPGQHGLARAGRSDQQEVVSAGSGDFESALRRLLPTDLGQVAVGKVPLPEGEQGLAVDDDRGERGNPQQMGCHRAKVGSAQGGDPFRQGCLGAVFLRYENLVEACLPGAEGRGEGTLDRPKAAVESQLGGDHGALQAVGGQTPQAHEHGQRDREVEGRPRLAKVGRREVDGDSLGTDVESRVLEGGPDAITRLPDRAVG